MGADLFGSLSEASCAAMVIGAQLFNNRNEANIMFPLIVISFGILACIVTTFLGTDI